jgi:uncharacterized protein with gpF-like domain
MAIRKEIQLAPVQNNLGVEIAYRKALRALLEKMHADIEAKLLAAWNEETDLVGFATDSSRSRILAIRRTLMELIEKWTGPFDKEAVPIATTFAKAARAVTLNAMQASLKKVDWTLEFKPTEAAKEAYREVVAQNVSLIRGIPAEHMKGIEQDVWAGVMKGFDSFQIRKALQARLNISDQRAVNISRDQTSKARAIFENQQRGELGITEAIWKHSHGGKHPRPSHVKADGKRFKVSEGMFLDGKWVWPGSEINCKCYSISIIPALERKK